MVKRVLSFIGWLLVAFILIGTLGVMSKGAILTGIGYLVWGLIFLPPLCRLTRRYGLIKNIAVRAVLFILVPLVFPAPPQPTATQPIPQPTPTKTLQATPTPTPTITVRQAPVITQTPEPIETPFLEPTEQILSPAPVPSVQLTREPQNILDEPETKVNAPSIDPDTPVRASISGSCECPYDTDKRGRSCGGRSAYSRPGGEEPVCYIKDKQ
ncbi:hypothetical protein CAL7716_060150 [Calothrix sp. PCC 7716]|nr:hypothetical protein CAL7716_060150 [Calothrix sp. PCC 7716]